MDAAFFRFLGPEMGRLLEGVRFETVFSPAPGFWTLAFSPHVILPTEQEGAACAFVLLRRHPQQGTLLLSPVKPVNPPEPPMAAMWLRKRLRSRRVGGFVCDWRRRSLALEVAGAGWLLLGPDDDPALVEALPEGFGQEAFWPTPEALQEDAQAPRSLRRALAREDREDRAAFLEAFAQGRAAGFFLSADESLTAQPLPWPEGRECLRYPTALQAARAHGGRAFFAALGPASQDAAKARTRANKRLETLDRDAKRLADLVTRQLWGEALAANLGSLDGRSKAAAISLEHPERGLLDLKLDPSRTLVENMERFFRQAAKGRRGLGHVERLRAEVLEGRLPPPRRPGEAAPKAASGQGVAKKGRTGRGADIPVHRFRTSDGFAVFRGKNAAANHRLLSEVARAWDYWFHAKGGPGSHVILRRDDPGRAVPRRSLEEAAALAGLASWQRGEARAEVLYAVAGAVRKIKGAPLGQVRLDEAESLLVPLEPDLEERLRDER